jgi:hypothetical protein
MSDIIPPAVHAKHHEFLDNCIPLLSEYLEERKEAKERWEKYRTSFFGAIFSAIGLAVVSVLAWVGGIVIEAIKHNQP